MSYKLPQWERCRSSTGVTELRAARHHEICEEAEGWLINTKRRIACAAVMEAL
jgi:hypothetical protein